MRQNTSNSLLQFSLVRPIGYLQVKHCGSKMNKTKNDTYIICWWLTVYWRQVRKDCRDGASVLTWNLRRWASRTAGYRPLSAPAEREATASSSWSLTQLYHHHWRHAVAETPAVEHWRQVPAPRCTHWPAPAPRCRGRSRQHPAGHWALRR